LPKIRDQKPWRRRWPFTEGLSLLLLAVSLGITAFALVAWRSSLQPPPRPAELRLLSGSVSSVRHDRDRYGGVSGVHFRLAAAGPELYYAGSYPSFPWADDCLRPGAPVTVGVMASRPDVWQLTCGGTLIADIDAISEARLENGRHTYYLGIGFVLSDLLWVWRILAARPPETGAPGRRRTRNRSCRHFARSPPASTCWRISN
jgi:hypothetical protein